MDSVSCFNYLKKQPPLAHALGCLCWQPTWKSFRKTDIKEEWDLFCSALCSAIRSCQADSGLSFLIHTFRLGHILAIKLMSVTPEV